MVVPTPEQIAYMLEHIDESTVSSIHISSGICVAFTFISLVLRVISRRYTASAFAIDDYFLFVGFVCLPHSTPFPEQEDTKETGANRVPL